MATNTRVSIDNKVLFEGFDESKESVSSLAREAGVSTKTIDNMLKYDGSPTRGFFSHGVEAICRVLKKDPAQIIKGKLRRRSYRRVESIGGPTGINGFDLRPTLACPVERVVTVPADTSPFEPCADDEAIELAPGAAVEFIGFDAASTWTHDPAAGIDSLIAQRPFVHPHADEPAILSADQLRDACVALDDMLRHAIVGWLNSFGIHELRQLAQKKMPVTDLIAAAGQVLPKYQRTLDPDWKAMPDYVAGLQGKLRASRRPINLNLRSRAHSGSGAKLWRSTYTAGQTPQGAGHAAPRTIVNRYGPAGESDRPAGSGYPVPAAPVGACILYAGTLDAAGLLVVREIVAFFAPGDRYTNTAGHPVFCRLACNDPFPGDNEGTIKIRIATHAPAAEPAS